MTSLYQKIKKVCYKKLLLIFLSYFLMSVCFADTVKNSVFFVQHPIEKKQLLNFLQTMFTMQECIVEKVGKTYREVQYDKKSRYILGNNTFAGLIVEAVIYNLLRPEDVLFIFDFDSTIIIKKEETPLKITRNGEPRGSKHQKKFLHNISNLKNMRYILEMLNSINIPWCILTARPDDIIKPEIQNIKNELVNMGILEQNIESFLSPCFQNYRININSELLNKFNEYKKNKNSFNELIEQARIPQFKINDNKKPYQEGNIILSSHIPKSWGIYYVLKAINKNFNTYPKFVIFIDDSDKNITRTKDSINGIQEDINKTYLDMAPLYELKRSTQFILIHYASKKDQRLFPQIFTDYKKTLFNKKHIVDQ
jgi:hypothetical protein